MRTTAAGVLSCLGRKAAHLLASYPPATHTPTHPLLPATRAQVVGGGRCPIVDTWWHTETGMHLLTPLPGATPLKPGSAALPFFGVEPVLVNGETGRELAAEGEAEGVLCVRHPWPAVMRTIYNDHARFEARCIDCCFVSFLAGPACAALSAAGW